jgi:hypothetical protein
MMPVGLSCKDVDYFIINTWNLKENFVSYKALEFLPHWDCDNGGCFLKFVQFMGCLCERRKLSVDRALRNTHLDSLIQLHFSSPFSFPPPSPYVKFIKIPEILKRNKIHHVLTNQK